jgi:hypothetical protein
VITKISELNPFKDLFSKKGRALDMNTALDMAETAFAAFKKFEKLNSE